VTRFRPPGAIFDCPLHPFYRDLHFPVMVEGENEDSDAHPDSAAEKQIPISQNGERYENSKET
jgi:hypothetical protein